MSQEETETKTNSQAKQKLVSRIKWLVSVQIVALVLFVVLGGSNTNQEIGALLWAVLISFVSFAVSVPLVLLAWRRLRKELK